MAAHPANTGDYVTYIWGVAMAQWLQHQTHDQKVAGSSPSRSGRRISSHGSTFCAGFGSTPVLLH